MAHEVAGPVRGMESVVASVSGYHGAERFDLIKLIPSLGASYVGAMSSSTTHLVCRRFEGQKYDLARKFKTHVVNHRWVEECVKQGKRVPEHPYTWECGEEVGSLLLPVPVNSKPYITRKKHKVLSDRSNFASASTRQIADSAFKDNRSDIWTDSHLLKECPELNRSSRRLWRGKRLITPHEESHLSPSMCFGRREMKSFSGMEILLMLNLLKGVNMVKRNAKRETLKLNASDSDQECYVVGGDDKYGDITSPSEQLNGKFVSTRKGGTQNGPYGREGAINGIIEDVDEIEDCNHDHQPSPEDSIRNDLPDSLERVSKDEPNAEKSSIEIDDVGQTDYVNSLSSSVELSCVICWTEYSSTRGILPCGHRFCYSCIRNWYDHMVLERKKTSTCPLCKTSFVSITKVEDSSGSQQKIYSQTIPHDQSTSEVYVVTDQGRMSSRAEVHSNCLTLSSFCIFI
ncbi:LOW QUALITY PROTEIN: uncharacterized protein LOC104419478 [Eucalyptus grandis]|uniref:LOW QUALITY PROTEIN: uncharacterized protein LOC104419478 n=1 Tax=Eucalyptus grandis TaxID=71139 RepID=UPI00192EA20E|nr:LOW QUALITY PROTEIN: uncharacterized protein LOC104419478 [Eucalyptus grandis]